MKEDFIINNYRVTDVTNKDVTKTMITILANNNITYFNGTQTELTKLTIKILDKENRVITR